MSRNVWQNQKPCPNCNEVVFNVLLSKSKSITRVATHSNTIVITATAIALTTQSCVCVYVCVKSPAHRQKLHLSPPILQISYLLLPFPSTLISIPTTKVHNFNSIPILHIKMFPSPLLSPFVLTEYGLSCKEKNKPVN